MASTPGRAGGAVAPYSDLAEVYDLIHADKPYAQEARQVRELATQAAGRRGGTLLDVACGSGRHLEHFTRWYSCVGVDPSPEMLRLARQRAPRATLVRGRMETLDLRREFDVVTCLFSAIGYVRTVAGLRRTLRRFARHTAPGGVLVLEPWIPPEAFRTGLVSHLVARSGPTTILRMDAGVRRGTLSTFDFHYLLGRPGQVEHAVERHVLGLFSRRTTESALRDAGYSPRYYPKGLTTRRGLYVAVRSSSARPAR